MKFLINNLYTEVVASNVPQELIEICIFSRVHFYKRRVNQSDIAKGKATRSQRFITERKIINYNYFDYKNNTIPTGILYKVFNYLDNNNICFDYEDRRVHPPRDKQFSEINTGIVLRKEYQEEAFRIMRNAERGIINHACNSGKTYLAIEICNQFGLQTLYIVPNKTLLVQTYNLFKEYLGNFVGIIGAGRFEPSLFNIATIQTLWTRFNMPEIREILFKVYILIIDEVHHLSFKSKNQLKKGAMPFNTYYQIAMATPNAYYRFGLTATPGEKDSLERGLLESVTSRVLHVTTQSQLILWGYSCKPTVKMIKHTINNKYQDWQTAYKEEIYDNYEFNKKVADIAENYVKQKKSVLIIITRVKTQLALLQELLPNAIIAYGKTKNREKIFKEFESKTNVILISTLVSEGINLPAVDILILASGNKSKKLVTQRLGRAVRQRTGKNNVIIIDFMFEGEKYTHQHSLNRLKYFKEEELFDVEIVENKNFFC